MGYLTEKKLENGVVSEYAKIDEFYIQAHHKQVKIHLTHFTNKEDRDAKCLPCGNSVIEINTQPPDTQEILDKKNKDLATFPFAEIMKLVYEWMNENTNEYKGQKEL